MAVAVLMSRSLQSSGQPRTARHPLRQVLRVRPASGRSAFLVQSSLTRLARLGYSMADDPTSDSTVQPDRVVASGMLIDVPAPKSFSGGQILLVVAIGVGVIVAVLVGVFARFVASGTSISGDVAFCLGAGLSFAVPLFVFAGYARAQWRVDQVLTAQRDGSLQDILSALLVQSPFQAPFNLKRVAQSLARQGRTGAAVRIAKPKRTAPIQPLSVPFEPLPLDESVPLFVGLEQEGGTVQDGTRAEQARDVSVDGSYSRRGLRRRILLSGGWVIVAMFAFNAAIGGVESYRVGHVTFNAVLWTLYFIVAVVGVGGRGAWRSRQQWLLVPGGLASRRARFRRRDWELHLFQRESSVLILRNQWRHFWWAYVADRQTVQMAGMTPREAVMLLRAWLSPLPTPPLERLSDLA